MDRGKKTGEVLSLAELSSMLGVTIPTAKKALENGLNYRKIGTRYLILREDVFRWFENSGKGGDMEK